MKNQYFGDVNDYVKYGLLRCFSANGLRIGVCWMLTPDDGRPDGRKVDYLSKPGHWKAYDPDLFAHLSQSIASPYGRSLCHIENSTWIPGATAFYGAIVPDARAERLIWYQNALSQLGDSDLIFFDPDNGIEIASRVMGKKNSSKYVYWSELTEAWNRTNAVLVFQHFPRVERSKYIAFRVEEMASKLSGSRIVALRSSNVLYLLAYRPCGSHRIEDSVTLIESKWSRRVRRHTCI